MAAIEDGLWAGLDPGLPVTLLPVRLETRFGTRRLEPSQGSAEVHVLRVRIYPDEISVVTAQDELQAAEVRSGSAFWAAGASRPAWEVLVRSVGVARAPYVAAQTRDGASTAATGPRQPPTARLLPDTWVILGWANGGWVIREQIDGVLDRLQVGPAATQPFAPEDPLLAADPSLRWLTSFDAAVAAGMATTIDLAPPGEPPPAWLERGLESLIVLGVRSGHGHEAESRELEELFAGQAADGRVGFLPVGTPTNNLRHRRSGWTDSPDTFAAYGRVVASGAPPVMAGAEGATSAALLTTALGLSQESLGALEHATDPGQHLARAMARAVFPATIGEFLGTLLQYRRGFEHDLTTRVTQLRELVGFASDFASTYVQARGPLPVLRVGRQPYGVLPATVLWSWQPGYWDSPQLPELVSLLRRLRNRWDGAAGNVSRVAGGTATGTAAALVAALGQGPFPHPGAYRARGATAPESVATIDLPGDHVASNPEDALNTLLFFTVRDSQSWRIGPVARSQGDASGPAAYLGDLAAGLVADEAAQPPDLLYQVVRRSLACATEFDQDAILERIAPNEHAKLVDVPVELRDAPLDAARAAAELFRTPLGELDSANTIPEEVRHRTIESLMEDGLEDGGDWFGPLLVPLYRDGTVDAVKVLADAGLEDAEYTRLFGEAIACATTRLDAWATGIAARRLEELRAERPTGAQIGAWGVLLDLKGPNVTRADPPPGYVPVEGLDGELRAPGPDGQVGWLHAPSLDQARMAGVLRAAELRYRGDGSSLASVDLTSRRARTARDVLEAVANGQPLGAVLGARLERALGDAGEHECVTVLRARFPQHRADGGAAAGQEVGAENVVPPEVADGLDVWEAGIDAVASSLRPHRPDRLKAALRELGVAVDAVADVLVAEGVHHVVTGRAEAAGATFAAIAQGGQPPVEVDALRTPRTGSTHTNRVLLALDPDLTAGGSGEWDTSGPRATLAPELEAWVEVVLADAAAISVDVSPADGGPAVSVRLADAGVSALDVVVESAGAWPGDAYEGDRRSLLEARLVAAAGLAVRAHVTGGADYEALLAMAGTVRSVLAAARPAVPADVAPPPDEAPGSGRAVVPGPPPPSPEALEGLAGRVREVLATLEAASDAVAAALGPEVEDAAPVEKDLLAAFAALGLPGSVVAGDSATAAAARAGAAAARAIVGDADRTVAETLQAAGVGLTDNRGANLDALRALPNAMPTLTAVVRVIAGEAVVPVIEVDSPTPARREEVEADTVEEWLTQRGRVRAALGDYDDLRLFQEAAGHQTESLAACQLPLNEQWIGGPLRMQPFDPNPGPGEGVLSGNPLRPWVRPAGSRLNLVVAGAAAFAGATMRALVLDEFGEHLPEPAVTTGLAAFYDAPNARPPQSVLLAVHPGDPADPNRSWGWQLLYDIVTETLLRARHRLVDIDDLVKVDDPHDVRATRLPMTFVRPPFTHQFSPGFRLDPAESLAANRFVR